MFALHFLITATFIAVPPVLVTDLGLASAGHWKVYLGVFVASLAGTIPLIMATERTKLGPALLVVAVLLAAVSQAALGRWHGSLWAFLGALTLFFAAFNYLEARLPALLTLAASSSERGAALGIFATAQFLGAFAGGTVGGVLLGRFGLPGRILGRRGPGRRLGGNRRAQRANGCISARTRLIRSVTPGRPGAVKFHSFTRG